MADLSKLSLEQLRNRFAELETEWYELENAITEREDLDKKQLAQEIKEKILDAGYEIEDILDLLMKRKKTTKATGNSRSYTIWMDPDNENNTYSRGPIPAWLKEKLMAAGLDPDNKEDRESFKQQYLKPLAS